MDRQVQDLLAKQAITEQIYNYCRAMDRIDHDLARGVWHDGGMADYGSIFTGTGAEFVDMVLAAHRKLVAVSHQITNIVIEVDGDTAVSEAYVTARLRSQNDGQQLCRVVCGRYVDRWSYREDRWAIDERIYIHDFDEIHPVLESRLPGWGRPDTSDPSYAAFETVGARS